MDAQLISLLTNVVAGAVGGNAVAAAKKEFNIGTLGNTLAGIVGGGLGGQLLSGVLGQLGATGMTGDIASSGIGGIAVTIVAALIKQYLNKTTPTA